MKTNTFVSRLSRCANTFVLKKELEKEHARIMQHMRLIYEENARRHLYLEYVRNLSEAELEAELVKIKKAKKMWHKNAVLEEMQNRNHEYCPSSPAYSPTSPVYDPPHYDPTGY